MESPGVYGRADAAVQDFVLISLIGPAYPSLRRVRSLPRSIFLGVPASGHRRWGKATISAYECTPMVMVPLKPPARLDEVARLLNLIALMPGRRDRPLSADLEGPYDVWFDGGACRYLTSLNQFDFADGASAWMSTVSLALKGSVTLASGETVSFLQEAPRQDLCVICGGALAEGGTFKQTPRGAAHVACG